MEGFETTGDDEHPEFEKLVAELETATKKLGLYLTHAAVVKRTPDGPPVLAADWAVGDLAWSKRVQDPEGEKMDDRFREIADDLKSDPDAPKEEPSWGPELYETLRKMAEGDKNGPEEA